MVGCFGSFIISSHKRTSIDVEKSKEVERMTSKNRMGKWWGNLEKMTNSLGAHASAPKSTVDISLLLPRHPSSSSCASARMNRTNMFSLSLSLSHLNTHRSMCKLCCRTMLIQESLFTCFSNGTPSLIHESIHLLGASKFHPLPSLSFPFPDAVQANLTNLNCPSHQRHHDYVFASWLGCLLLGFIASGEGHTLFPSHLLWQEFGYEVLAAHQCATTKMASLRACSRPFVPHRLRDCECDWRTLTLTLMTWSRRRCVLRSTRGAGCLVLPASSCRKLRGQFSSLWMDGRTHRKLPFATDVVPA